VSTQPVCTREIASIFTEEILKLASKERTGRVTIIGCEHIELLIELAQHGFVDVACRDALAGPHADEMAADIIVVPIANRKLESPAVLSRLSRGLRPGGVLFLGTAGTLLMTRKRQIQALLIQQGFAFTRIHVEPADIDLWCCRKIPVWQARAA